MLAIPFPEQRALGPSCFPFSSKDFIVREMNCLGSTHFTPTSARSSVFSNSPFWQPLFTKRSPIIRCWLPFPLDDTLSSIIWGKELLTILSQRKINQRDTYSSYKQRKKRTAGIAKEIRGQCFCGYIIKPFHFVWIWILKKSIPFYHDTTSMAEQLQYWQPWW